MSAAKPVVIDTDPGLDDALALILAMRSPAIDVRAITVVAGNVPLTACTSNVLRILEVLRPERRPAVFEGCSEPLSPRAVRAEHVHGNDGLGGASTRFPVRSLGPNRRHAAEVMVELAKRYGSELTLITLGPLTNVATALQRAPNHMKGIGQLVVMGGSADGRGNATPSAEFNFYADPSAAKAVVRSGLPVTLVGLNVTEKALLPRARFNAALNAMPQCVLRSFLAAVSEPYFDFCRKEKGRDACALHDPLAVGAAIDSTLIRSESMRCDVVDSPGLTRGTVLARRARNSLDSGPPPVRVAVEVETEQFVDLFLETVCGV